MELRIKIFCPQKQLKSDQRTYLDLFSHILQQMLPQEKETKIIFKEKIFHLLLFFVFSHLIPSISDDKKNHGENIKEMRLGM
jgi:hypothetical protein